MIDAYHRRDEGKIWWNRNLSVSFSRAHGGFRIPDSVIFGRSDQTQHSPIAIMLDDDVPSAKGDDNLPVILL